jgi:hypothetical protein
MKIVDTLLTVLCISVPVGILVIAAIFGIRARTRYANRIREALARGAFADMNTPEIKSRFRRLATFALVGMFGMILSIAILTLQLRSRFTDFYGVTAAIAIIFGILVATAGSLMQREINRRL